jgi:hypothetical protein
MITVATFLVGMGIDAVIYPKRHTNTSNPVLEPQLG